MINLGNLKPVLTALALPPVPLLVLVIVALVLVRQRRSATGWTLAVAALALLWLSETHGAGRWLARDLLPPPPVLTAPDLLRLQQAGLRQDNAQQGGPQRGVPADHARTVIVVLGGGRTPRADEYGLADLDAISFARLRYANWLARQTGLPVLYSGGVGWAERPGAAAPEAEIAARIARDELDHPLTWVETQSRDTAENAAASLAMLRPLGVQEIVLVTHAWHMPRALRLFRQAAGSTVTITPAPMGFFVDKRAGDLDWLPSHEGALEVRLELREILGLAALDLGVH